MEAKNVTKNDKISDVEFNMMGKDPIFGPHLPNTSKTIYTVVDVKQVVMDIANGLINGITKDRIKVSLATYNNQVVDSEHSTCSLVIAVYFDINDSNFVQKADNEFGTVIKPSNKNVAWFLNKYALKAKDKGGKPCDVIIRSEGGIHIVLNVRKIFDCMTDAYGYKYQLYSGIGTRQRKMDIKVDVVKHHDGNRFIIDNFVVTKTLATKSKFEIGELTSKELRYIAPQLIEIVPQLKEAVNMMTITDACYRLLKHKDGESPRMKVMLVDKHSGTVITCAYLIIYRRHWFRMFYGINAQYCVECGSTPVMNLNNLVSLPDKYQASIMINMMAEFAIQKFVQDTLTDPNVVASNTNFYNEHNYNTLGKFTEECLAYLFPEYQKYGIENNFLYHDDLVDSDID